jgi:phosphatidylserine/phosphatidylglycerophosphate/cardiolipin synthase-like enzyme
MTTLHVSDLDRFSKSGFPVGYPPTWRRFFAPVDDVAGALRAVITSAERSIVISMYGFDDEFLADAIREKLEAEHVAVSLTLDSSQAGGVHERAILAREDYPASIIAVGRSEQNAIIHTKLCVVDGLIAVSGSTNWSGSGETKQDNELTVSFDPIDASVVAARCLAIHNYVLQQTRGRLMPDSDEP